MVKLKVSPPCRLVTSWSPNQKSLVATEIHATEIHLFSITYLVPVAGFEPATY